MHSSNHHCDVARRMQSMLTICAHWAYVLLSIAFATVPQRVSASSLGQLSSHSSRNGPFVPKVFIITMVYRCQLFAVCQLLISLIRSLMMKPMYGLACLSSTYSPITSQCQDSPPCFHKPIAQSTVLSASSQLEKAKSTQLSHCRP